MEGLLDPVPEGERRGDDHAVADLQGTIGHHVLGDYEADRSADRGDREGDGHGS